MIKLNSIFFLLFLTLITGAFAAMAQNTYGITLLGWGMAGFAFFCFIGGVITLINKRLPKLLAYEYVVLTIVLTIITLRIFLIYFTNVELIFTLAGSALVIIYILRITNALKTVKATNKPLAHSLVLLYSSIIIYILAMVINPYSIRTAEAIGVLGFIVFILSLLSTSRIKSVILREKEVKWTKYLSLQPNRAILLVALFLSFTFYSAANYFNIVSDIQSSKMPKGYYQLAKEAENGNDIPKNGKFRYQDYQEHMASFMTKQGLNE